MKLTFVKTLQGHEMEFVRLMYPLRYDIIIRILNSNPLKFSIIQNPEGGWKMNNEDGLPGWVNELSVPILSIIEENEKAVD